MRRDLYDLIGLAAVVALGGAILLLLSLAPGGSAAPPGKGLDAALERELREQARLDLYVRLYQPVETLLEEGRAAQALLVLAEVQRDWPGEAHGLLLQGRLQEELGAMQEAAASYAAAVRLNGAYVDRRSPLSRRPRIESFVTRELERSAASPGVDDFRRTLYYLKSRLAGGCE